MTRYPHSLAPAWLLLPVVMSALLGCGSPHGRLIIIDDRPQDTDRTPPPLAAATLPPPPPPVLRSDVEWQRQAEAGDPQAMYRYARHLLSTANAAPDRPRALEYLRQAMALDNRDALLATANGASGLDAGNGELQPQDLQLALDCYLRAERLGAEVIYPSDHTLYPEAVNRQPPDLGADERIRSHIYAIQDQLAGVLGPESYPVQRARLLKGGASGDVEAELRLSRHPGAGGAAVQHRATALELGHPFMLCELAQKKATFWDIVDAFDANLLLDRNLSGFYGEKSYPQLRLVCGPLAKRYGGLPRPQALAEFALTMAGQFGRKGWSRTQAELCLRAAVKDGFRPDDAYLDRLVDPEAPARSGADHLSFLNHGREYRGEPTIAYLLYKRYRALDYSAQSAAQRARSTAAEFTQLALGYADEMRLVVCMSGRPETQVRLGDDSLASGDLEWAAKLFSTALEQIMREQPLPEDSALADQAHRGLTAANVARLPQLRSAALTGVVAARWSLALLEAGGLGAPVDRPAAQATFAALAKDGNTTAALNAFLMGLGSFPDAATAPLPDGFLVITPDLDDVYAHNNAYLHFAKRLRSATIPALQALTASAIPASDREEARQALAQTRSTLDAAVALLTGRLAALPTPVLSTTRSSAPLKRTQSAEETAMAIRAATLRGQLAALDIDKQIIAAGTHSKSVTYDYHGVYYHQHSSVAVEVSNWTPAREKIYREQTAPLLAELRKIEPQLKPNETDLANAKMARLRLIANEQENFDLATTYHQNTTRCINVAIASCRELMVDIDALAAGPRKP